MSWMDQKREKRPGRLDLAPTEENDQLVLVHVPHFRIGMVCQYARVPCPARKLRVWGKKLATAFSPEFTE
eukprot:s1336_g7.t1